MRTRYWSLAALIAMVTAWPVAGGETKSEKPAKPTLVIRVAPPDTLVGDVRSLAELAGKAGEVEQAHTMLKSLAGEGKGLAGIDTTKPLGAYGYLGPNGIDSEVVVLLPIAD